MSKYQIAIVEPSEIINEGLVTKIKASGLFHIVHSFYSFDTIQNTSVSIQILIINPLLIINREKEFEKLCNNKKIMQTIALVYGFEFPNDVMLLFDDKYSIIKPFSELISKLKTVALNDAIKKKEKNYLSEREKEVLTYLAKGYSIKEIADKIHLSPHTVLSHRKNISAKTGIKTIAGLTVYAVSNQLISIEEIDF